MKSQRILTFILLSFLFAYDNVALGWSNEQIDHSLYGRLLEKYAKGGVVDYRGFKNEEAKLDQYLKTLEETDIKSFPRNEQFAFYVNAYNAWTIKLILGSYPGVKSIKDLGSFLESPWKKKICRLNGEILSLDDIEHTILRGQFKDPRVHFAVNCASKSCPPLISEPYRGSTLDAQLDNALKEFINDSLSNRLEGNTLYVSKIFKWFKDDFGNDIVGFFIKYAKGNLKKELEAKKETTKIKYLHYDWSLNGK